MRILRRGLRFQGGDLRGTRRTHHPVEGRQSQSRPQLYQGSICLRLLGDFFAPYAPERRAEGIRNHLRTYSDPRMRADLLDYIAAGGDGLKPFVVEGALLLKSGADPTGYYGPPQDAETRRIAGAAGPTRLGHNPARLVRT